MATPTFTETEINNIIETFLSNIHFKPTNRLETLPEEVLNIIWRKVFDECIQYIPYRANYFNHRISDRHYKKLREVGEKVKKSWYRRKQVKDWQRKHQILIDNEAECSIKYQQASDYKRELDTKCKNIQLE